MTLMEKREKLYFRDSQDIVHLIQNSIVMVIRLVYSNTICTCIGHSIVMVIRLVYSNTICTCIGHSIVMVSG